MAEHTEFDARSYTITIRRTILNGEQCFHGRVLELLDLEAFEPSHIEAYDFLVGAIESAKETFDEEGREFPAPAPQDIEHSGRITLRLPRSLHAQLDAAAKTEGTSLNQHIVYVLASKPNPSGIESKTAAIKSAITDHFRSSVYSDLLVRNQTVGVPIASGSRWATATYPVSHSIQSLIENRATIMEAFDKDTYLIVQQPEMPEAEFSAKLRDVFENSLRRTRQAKPIVAKRPAKVAR